MRPLESLLPAERWQDRKLTTVDRNFTLLMLLGLNLSGCASKSPPAVCPPLPAAPSVTMQQPSKPYSESVQQSLQRWREKLTDTSQTSRQ